MSGAWTRSAIRLALGIAVALPAGCRSAAGAEKDSVEAKREEKAFHEPEQLSDLPTPPRQVVLATDGFGPSKQARVADAAMEIVVLAALAAAIAGAVQLFRHRLSLLAFLVSMGALVVALCAFFKSWG
jgi:hypothetical protein